MSRPIVQNAKARVTMQLEITVSSNWGPDCSIKQIHEQATSEAYGMLRNLSPENAAAFVKAVRIFGEPQVTTVIVGTEKF